MIIATDLSAPQASGHALHIPLSRDRSITALPQAGAPYPVSADSVSLSVSILLSTQVQLQGPASIPVVLNLGAAARGTSRDAGVIATLGQAQTAILQHPMLGLATQARHLDPTALRLLDSYSGAPGISG